MGIDPRVNGPIVRREIIRANRSHEYLRAMERSPLPNIFVIFGTNIEARNKMRAGDKVASMQ